MNESQRKNTSKRFADALRAGVEEVYCIGGCSRDEYAAACADFLMTAANMFIRSITTDVEVPPLR